MEKTVPYRIFCLLCACGALFFCACSAQLFTAEKDSSPLRSRVQGVYAALDWEDELAPEGLERPSDYSAASLPDAALGVLEGENPVYPELAGFGSTDNSLLPATLVKRLDAFFYALPEITDSGFLKADHTYLPVFLFYTFADFKINRRIYGKPVRLADGTYEIPVRLYSGASFMDALVFVSGTGENFVVDQIQAGEISGE